MFYFICSSTRTQQTTANNITLAPVNLKQQMQVLIEQIPDLQLRQADFDFHQKPSIQEHLTANVVNSVIDRIPMDVFRIILSFGLISTDAHKNNNITDWTTSTTSCLEENQQKIPRNLRCFSAWSCSLCCCENLLAYI